jgi:hypothetical protein
VTAHRSGSGVVLLVAMVWLLGACGGRSDAEVVEGIVNRLLTQQVEALELAAGSGDASGDGLSPAVDDKLEGALVGRALDRARATLPAAAVDPAAAGVPEGQTQAAARRFAIDRIVRSEPSCVIAVGEYAFRGLEDGDANPLPTAVSLSALGPDGSLAEVRDWRLRDAISVVSLEDEDLRDPDLLDTSCTWER